MWCATAATAACRRRPPAACPRLRLLLAQLGVAPTWVAAAFYGLQTSEKEMLRKELANANADVSGASEEVRPPCTAAAAAGCCLALQLYPLLLMLGRHVAAGVRWFRTASRAAACSCCSIVLLPPRSRHASVLWPSQQLSYKMDTHATTCCT